MTITIQAALLKQIKWIEVKKTNSRVLEKITISTYFVCLNKITKFYTVSSNV